MAFGLNHLRYETGSHVDVESFNLQLGVARKFQGQAAAFTVGAFIEGGRGGYDTYNSFPGAPDARGEGDASYLGGGLLGRIEFPGAGPGRLFADASVRLGRTRSDFSSLDVPADLTTYDIATPYHGFHAALGYAVGLGEAAELELAARYVQTTRRGRDAATPSGTAVRFEDVDSRRVRVGARATFKAGETLKPYIGAAWERELDGEAKASVRGLAIEPPNMKGDTAIGEMGLSARLTPDGPASLDFGLQGHAGRRRGVSGSLRLKIEF
jgi:outer membrane autotransporter protein